MQREELPQDVVISIQKILGNQNTVAADPLDRLVDFNAVTVLNQLFPDESSLARIESVQHRLQENERALQAEIDALRTELQHGQDPNRMQEIQEMISDLLGQMSRIREKATESEAIVRNITKDIQVLDIAKKNLVASMTTLKRFQMLVNAVSQLEDLVREKKYPEIAQTLAAVKQITASFKQYTSVDRISRIWRHVQTLQGGIRSQVDADFDLFYLQDPAKPIKLSVIHDACQVVDVLGGDSRNQIIERYVAIELKEYRRIFRPADEAGYLDNISRRFAWFRRVLNTHEAEQGRAFPEEWRVGWFLCSKFIDITRDDISNLLSKAGSSLTVSLLLDTLQQCAEFETSIARKYSATVTELLQTTSPSVSQAIKPITSAFEPHMGVFVDAQDKAIADMLAPHRAIKSTRASLDLPQPSSDAEDGGSAAAIVLSSSTELFYFYSQSLDQCSKLSTRTALFNLCGVQKKWLRVYADEVLAGNLRKLPVHPTIRKSLDTRYDPDEARNACLLINTSDYCQTTALELEENIQRKIDDEYKEKITLQPERELFVGVISAGIAVLLRELESACSGPLSTLSRTVWPTMNHVSGQSPYVNDLVQAIEQFMDLVRPLVEQKKYLRNFCDKAATLVVTKFTNSIVKSRPLGDIGGEQLMIDLQLVKSSLLRISGDLSASTYSRNVSASTLRLEKLFKVLVTPVDPAEGFILNYTLIIGDASFSNFQKVLDLKGTPKNEQNNLLDSFLTITSTKSELETTSFLSSLDMDPVQGQQASILGSPGGSRVALPSMLMGPGAAVSPAESIFAALSSPPTSGPSTGSDTASSKGGDGDQKQKVFPDLRRFVNFGLRRDSTLPS